MNTLSYRGFLVRVEFDEEDELLVGRIVGIADGVTFHADSVSELTVAFHEAVEDYIETCGKVGKPATLSFSERMTFELDPDLHRRAALAAEKAGIDLSRFAVEALEAAVGEGK